MRGMCAGCVRDVRGMCAGCVWDVRGMCVGCARVLTANRANNRSDRAKSRNKRRSDRENPIDNGKSLPDNRNSFLGQPALLVGRSGGKSKGGVHFKDWLYYTCVLLLYILSTQRVPECDNRQNTQHEPNMIIHLHRAIYLQPRLRFFAGFQMKHHPIALRRENIVEIVYAKGNGRDHTQRPCVTPAAAREILPAAYQQYHRENEP